MVGGISGASASEPVLSIQSGNVVKKFTRAQLLKNSNTIEVENDPAYPNRKMTYQAVPVKKVFEGISIPKDATLLFKCTDGFSAPISPARLLELPAGEAVAYIAVESTKKKWPILKSKGASAGPFYLVWVNAHQSHIGTEEWPFQLSGFEVKPSIASQYPRIVPSAELSEKHQIRLGFQIFLKNCFACHTMNGEGNAKMGPDLNLPHNPTEYLKADYLRKLIRDPQSLRAWPLAKMNAFSERMISEEEMDQLVAYLKHMSERKNNN